jgi:hypothetical protein
MNPARLYGQAGVPHLKAELEVPWKNVEDFGLHVSARTCHLMSFSWRPFCHQHSIRVA